MRCQGKFGASASSDRQRVGPLKDRRANTSLAFAAATSVILASIGAAVDFGRVVHTRNAMQGAADAAVIAAARFAGADATAREAEADAVFAANLPADLAGADGALDKNGQVFTYAADFTLETVFLNILGIDSVGVETSAAATAASTPMDVALVLDSSGSMAQSDRMVELKAAVKLFLSSFTSGGEVQVAVIPFDSQVRVEQLALTSSTSSSPPNPYATTDCATITDPQDKAACTADQANAAYANCSLLVKAGIVDDYLDSQFCNAKYEGFRFDSTGAYFEASNTSDSYRYRAVTSGGRNYIYRDPGDSCASYDWTTYACGGFVQDGSTKTIYNQPAQPPAEPNPETQKTATDETQNNDLLMQPADVWSGCVIDRTQPYDIDATAAVAATPATLYPKSNCARPTLLAVRPFTNDLAATATYIDGLQPSGATNVTIGIQWGMEAFTTAHPLTGARAGARKIMIVLTDGENTQNRWYGNGTANTPNRAQINARTLAACTKAKDAGIELFTIRLINGDAALLSACASTADRYFPVAAASELQATFADIARAIRKIYLAS